MMNVSMVKFNEVGLDDFNEGTNPSLSHQYVPEPTHQLFSD